jgi:hypothetical protein
MALVYCEAIRNAQLDAMVAWIGPSPSLRLFDADGLMLACLVLPDIWASPAHRGMIGQMTPWCDTGALQAGDAVYWQLWKGDLPCLMGTLSVAGAGGDLQLSSLHFQQGRPWEIREWTITAGNVWP